MPARTVQRIHFEDYGGREFERLVFAYHLRAGWRDLAWYGQTGSDLGRDIIGIEPFDDRPAQRTVIQCVNRAQLPLAKAKHDMTQAIAAPTGAPDAFKFVCRGDVSGGRRDGVKGASRKLGVNQIDIWSGAEFEEELRLRAEPLLRRFVEGDVFPDTANELRRFVDDFPDLSDQDTLALMAAVLDRPAFRTPFMIETNFHAFEQAIEDTISALNTGIWRTREGAEIRRIPSLHTLRDANLRATISKVVRQVDEVRRVFKRHSAAGRIEHCQCGDPNCPTFMVDPKAARDLDQARNAALSSFADVWPGFAVRMG